MSWGGLNNALTAWRTAVMRRFPDKDTASDGARADAAHGSTSQHQADADGTVDAYDMDVNLLDASPESGSATERRLIEAMKLDFEQDPHGRSQLWIHQREIANGDIGPWREREYTGKNPHDKHVHWQSRQAREDDGREWPMPHTDRLLRELRGEDDMNATEMTAWANSAAGRAALRTAAEDALEARRPYFLKRISDRGWSDLSVDGKLDYIIEALVATSQVDADGDGQVDDTATVQGRLDRVEKALAEIRRALVPS